MWEQCFVFVHVQVESCILCCLHCSCICIGCCMEIAHIILPCLCHAMCVCGVWCLCVCVLCIVCNQVDGTWGGVFLRGCVCVFCWGVVCFLEGGSFFYYVKRTRSFTFFFFFCLCKTILFSSKRAVFSCAWLTLQYILFLSFILYCMKTKQNSYTAWFLVQGVPSIALKLRFPTMSWA